MKREIGSPQIYLEESRQQVIRAEQAELPLYQCGTMRGGYLRTAPLGRPGD
ncbi:MAG: hypothetical protein LBV45_10930 [Xanthomonadaceae bacterium]|jgi:hypothetical protein|nr:hypothetical protein [Xanthomonadaceae bacterium]